MAMAALLVWQALHLPASTLVGRYTGRPVAIGTWQPLSRFYLVRQPTGLDLIDTAQESMDGVTRLAAAGAPVVAIEAAHRREIHGVWAGLWERERFEILLIPLTGTWSNTDLAEARRALLAGNLSPHSNTQPLAGWIDLASVRRRAGTILWGGVAQDLLALVAAAVLVVSLRASPRWVSERWWSRAARRRARGLCPVCGYNLRGLEQGVCPECGNTPSIGPGRPT